MSIRKSILATLGVAGLIALAPLAAQAQSTQLVRKENLSYVGSFKLPTVSGNGFAYGGISITHNPARNSLFVVGHVYDLDIAEVSIPNVGGTATVLQPLTSAINFNSVGSGQVYSGGSLVFNNRLYANSFVYYDATGAQSNSHFSRSLTLNSGSTTGPYRVGSMGAGFYSGYMAHIPAEWQSKLGGPALTGNCCLSIISRTSYGPSVSSFNPEATGNSAQTLVYYDQQHQTLGTYGASGTHPVFNGTTRITGVFFPEGTASVIFFGSTGTGPYCYGEADACNDPAGNGKGEHAYPYRAYMWAYNANDLAAVRAGTKQPWEATPYATWDLSEFGNVNPDFSTGGSAYDPTTGRLYLSEKYGDSDGRPLIHVYRIGNAAQVQRPQPPTSVSAQ